MPLFCGPSWATERRTESGAESIDEHNSTMRGVQRIVGQSRVAGSRGMATEAQRKCIFRNICRNSSVFLQASLGMDQECILAYPMHATSI